MTTCEYCWAHSELTGDGYETTVRRAEREHWPCTKNTEEGARLRAGQFWDQKRKVDTRKVHEAMETLRCPVCGYTIRRVEHPSVVHCGPHKRPDGSPTPAVRMLVVREETK